MIKNGSIIDGTASPAYRADVAIKDGKIVAVARGIEGGKQVIDAKGLVVTPGFIDSHSHSDNAVLTWPDQQEKIEQGITTSIGGQCGSFIAPIGRDVNPAQAGQIGDFGKYAKTAELIELAKVAGEYHGLVAAHIRNEGPNLIKATEEFIKVVKEAGVRGIHSHHKASVKENWGKVTHTLRMLDEANEHEKV